jgi:hypothetical protein
MRKKCHVTLRCVTVRQKGVLYSTDLLLMSTLLLNLIASLADFCIPHANLLQIHNKYFSYCEDRQGYAPHVKRCPS